MAYTYLVPSDTARILTTHAENCQNLALIFGRYIPHEAIEDKYVDNDKKKPKVVNQWLENTLERFTGDYFKKQIGYQAYKQRWFALTEGSARFQTNLRGRMVVGLGGKNPLEFGITLDRLTGLPYIPGSALKGLARSYALLTIYADAKRRGIEEPLDKFEEKIMQGEYQSELLVKHFYDAFGTTENAGSCIFYHAIPIFKKDDTIPIFVLDVMTPHFADYYTDQRKMTAPSDDLQPVPITYVCVREGLSFDFAIGLRTRTSFLNLDVHEQAWNWLQSGLTEMGIGAKTAQGYGVFARIETDK
ncbi:MAG: type III-B CRISPR module RAMP protein Cmr6 [bacterium]|nr:type III-B CRISPR module RAMP protein Cmr6 [bacterium]